MSEPKVIAKAIWSVALDVECPHCDFLYDYNGSNHCSEGGFESLNDVTEKAIVEDVVCPACKGVFDLHVQEGL